MKNHYRNAQGYGLEIDPDANSLRFYMPGWGKLPALNLNLQTYALKWTGNTRSLGQLQELVAVAADLGLLADLILDDTRREEILADSGWVPALEPVEA